MAQPQEHNILSIFIVLIINISVLYYVSYVAQEKCNCLVDWRNKYIQIYCVAVIVLNLIIYLFSGSIDPALKGIVVSSVLVAGIIYLYALYTYTHQLDKDGCKCATEDNEYLHKALYYYSYLFYVQVVLVTFIVGLLLARTVGLIDVKDSMIKTTKTKKVRKSKK
jgi:glucan phosphoethanolaminetransferase (alkaline phosphatase superfamily)